MSKGKGKGKGKAGGDGAAGMSAIQQSMLRVSSSIDNVLKRERALPQNSGLAGFLPFHFHFP